MKVLSEKNLHEINGGNLSVLLGIEAVVWTALGGVLIYHFVNKNTK